MFNTSYGGQDDKDQASSTDEDMISEESSFVGKSERHSQNREQECCNRIVSAASVDKC